MGALHISSCKHPGCSQIRGTRRGYGGKKNYGKTVMGVVCFTFVSEKGKIEHAFYNVKAGTSASAGDHAVPNLRQAGFTIPGPGLTLHGVAGVAEWQTRQT